MHLNPADMARRAPLRVEKAGSPGRAGLDTLAQVQEDLAFVLFDRYGAHLRAEALVPIWLEAAVRHPSTKPIDVFIRGAGPGYVAHGEFEEELAAHHRCRARRSIDGRLEIEFADLGAVLHGGVMSVAVMVEGPRTTAAGSPGRDGARTRCVRDPAGPRRAGPRMG